CYGAAGTYRVVVVVRDSSGDSGTGNLTVTVVAPIPPPGRAGGPLSTPNLGTLAADEKERPLESTISRSPIPAVVEMFLQQSRPDDIRPGVAEESLLDRRGRKVAKTMHFVFSSQF